MQLMGNVFHTDTTKQRKTDSSVPFTEFSPVSPQKGKKENKNILLMKHFNQFTIKTELLNCIHTDKKQYE